MKLRFLSPKYKPFTLRVVFRLKMVANDEEVLNFKQNVLHFEHWGNKSLINQSGEISLEVESSCDNNSLVCEFAYYDLPDEYYLQVINNAHYEFIKQQYINSKQPIPNYKFIKRDCPQEYKTYILRLIGV